MKNKYIELDVDFIDGQDPLTKEEELMISAFIKAEKEKRNLKLLKNKPTAKQKTKQLQ